MPDTGPPPTPLWNPSNLNDPHAAADKALRVERMFDAIAPTYERFNTIMTGGGDRRWRRRMVRAVLPEQGEWVLDVACGTGDVLRTFARLEPGLGGLIGLDFSAGMLAQAVNRPAGHPSAVWVRADALRLPLADQSVNIVSLAFGLRNFTDMPAALAEFHRVLAPGGRLVILETGVPTAPGIREFHQLYTRYLLPWLGRLIARDRVGAYRYLPASVATFANARQVCEAMRAAGFRRAYARRMMFGSVMLYLAKRS